MNHIFYWWNSPLMVASFKSTHALAKDNTTRSATRIWYQVSKIQFIYIYNVNKKLCIHTHTLHYITLQYHTIHTYMHIYMYTLHIETIKCSSPMWCWRQRSAPCDQRGPVDVHDMMGEWTWIHLEWMIFEVKMNNNEWRHGYTMICWLIWWLVRYMCWIWFGLELFSWKVT
jgi:hypothetical protein